jgi:hypothetical protein
LDALELRKGKQGILLAFNYPKQEPYALENALLAFNPRPMVRVEPRVEGWRDKENKAKGSSMQFFTQGGGGRYFFNGKMQCTFDMRRVKNETYVLDSLVRFPLTAYGSGAVDGLLELLECKVATE